MNELREGIPPQLYIVQFFHNEKGKTGELVGGPFAPIVGFSSCRPSQFWIERTFALGAIHPSQSGTKFSARFLLVLVAMTPTNTE